MIRIYFETPEIGSLHRIIFINLKFFLVSRSDFVLIKKVKKQEKEKSSMEYHIKIEQFCYSSIALEKNPRFLLLKMSHRVINCTFLLE